MNLVGCAYQEQMYPGDFKFDENLDMQVTTKDTIYKFAGDDYYCVNDTLIATVLKSVDNRTKLKYNINIPVETIEMIEVERMNILGTTLIILPVVLVIAFIFSLEGP
jgi:hypothetical protein